MPISDLFGLLQKQQTTPDKYLASSVNVVATGQHGAARAPFSQDRGIRAFRSWVYAASTINANAVASLPLRLYAKKDETSSRTRSIPRHRKAYLLGDQTNDVRPSSTVIRKAVNYGNEMEEVVGSHPVTDLLSTANPFLNGFDLTVLRILYGELTGNAYLHPVVDEASGLPGELWPLAPQYVEVIPDEEEFIAGYLYGIDAQKKQVFETDEVIHFRRPNPANLFYGLGKVEAAFGSIQANQALHEMDLSTFENSARPDYAVVVKGNSSGDQLDRFQQQVENRLRGTRKDGSFITVTGDVQFTPLNFPPKDLAGREEIVEEIAAVFGVPVTMLKANDPNLASASTGFAQWREGTILPLCRMDEEELNQSLLPLFGLEDTHCLAYDNPVPSDKAFELSERQTAVAGGWRTPNEARMEEGREPVEEDMADRLLVNGQPLGGMDPLAGGLGADIDSDIEISSPEPDPIREAASLLESTKALERLIVETGDHLETVKDLQSLGLSRKDADRLAKKRGGKNVVVRRSDDLYDTKEEAEAVATAIGCSGSHTHEVDGQTRFMPCERMEDYSTITGERHRDDEDLDLVADKAIADVDLQPTEGMAALAERGLRLREEYGRGGTEVGVARARDIKNRENLSPETVGRMANFFSRHRVDLDAPAAKPNHEEYPSAGVVAWLLWGGDPANPDEAGVAWSARKLEEIERAREKAKDDPSTPAKPSERIEGSDENPEGSASGTRGGIEISDETEKGLRNKVDEHNEEHGDKKGKKVNLGMLKAVFRRGAGAFSSSHRPGMTRQQWSMGRVNAFLYLVRNGRPENAKYVGDNDLLPKDHPKYAEKEKESKSCSCCETKSIGDPKAYHWPEETKWYRLSIEGLLDDYDRLRPKSKDGKPDADDDIRSGERKTPAMAIASLSEKMLDAVREEIEKSLKGQRKKAFDRDGEIRAILEGLAEGRKTFMAGLIREYERAAIGGGSTGAARLNEILEQAGRELISAPGTSKRLDAMLAKRAAAMAESVVVDTVTNFLKDIPEDEAFDLGAEINRLESSLGVTRKRAETIARTESANAYHEGQIDVWKETGGVQQKKFLVAPGACEFCKAVDKKYGAEGTAIGIDEPMVKAGQVIRGTDGGSFKPGKTSQGIVHPNCRCDFVPVLEL